MKGLLSAATVGSLMYGAGHVFKGQANFFLHDVSPCRDQGEYWLVDNQ